MLVKGKSGLAYMDSFVKSAGPHNYAWGITTGPGTFPDCQSDHPTTIVLNIDQYGDTFVKMDRNDQGCAVNIAYCVDYDPTADDVDYCLSGWEEADLVTDPFVLADIERISHCTDDRDPTTSKCNECSFVTEGMLWYKIAGKWYTIGI